MYLDIKYWLSTKKPQTMRDLSYKKDVDVIVDQLVVCLEAHIRDSISSALPQENFFDFFVTIFLQRQFIQPSASRRWNALFLPQFSAWTQGGVSVWPWEYQGGSDDRLCSTSVSIFLTWMGKATFQVNAACVDLMPPVPVRPLPAATRRSSPW
jgi:hypothetical protein